MLFFRKILRYSLLIIAFYSFSISLFFALIHATFTINTITSIIGMTLFLSGLILYLRNQVLVKNQSRLLPMKKIISTQEQQRTVYTNGGTYNEEVGGDYIGRDYIRGDYVGRDYIRGDYVGRDSVKKSIHIKNQQSEIGYDISEILGDFKDSLNEILVKNLDPVKAISDFAKDLAEELRKNPDLKASLDDKENSSEQELANKIIIDLLTKTYDQISQITQITQSGKIQKVNNSSALDYIYYTLNDEIDYTNDRDNILYNGYTILLARDHENMWKLKIQREDNSLLDLSKQRRFSSKDNAIGTAKKKIDKDRIANWENNINPPE